MITIMKLLAAPMRLAHRGSALLHAAAAAPRVLALSEAYAQRVESGALTADAAQRRVVKKYMDKLQRQLQHYRLPVLPVETDEEQTSGASPQPESPAPPVLVPRGLYVHGHVGTGKSMLMDLFFDHVDMERKRRVHFNKFMLEVHQRLQRVKQEHLQLYGRQRNIVLNPRRDAISIVAEELVHETHLLCFDEFQVTDIADAMIMRKLFAVFFGRGGVMVATSNTPPHELYKDGTNREYFLPFLQQLAAHTKVVDMNSIVDYRTQSHATGTQSFLYPLTEETDRALNALVLDAAAGAAMERLCVPVMMGRQLHVTGTRSGVACVTFDELCNTEKGAADYKALCENFHTVALTHVPQLEMRSHDQARRLILLIDELYEHRTRLICSAEVAPAQVFQFDDAPLQGQALAQANAEREKKQLLAANEKQGVPSASSWDSPTGSYTPAKMAGLQVANLCSLQDLKIAFKRAVSRLSEMQSDKYLRVNTELQAVRTQRLAHSLG